MGNTVSCCSDVARSKEFKIPPQPAPPQHSPQPSPRQQAGKLQASVSVSEVSGFIHTKQGSEVPPLPSDLERSDLDTIAPTDIDQQDGDSDNEEPPRAPVNWIKGELLGQGAFGRVYKCMDQDTGELFAVKQVQLNKEEHNRRHVEEYIRTVKAEIAHLSKLKHENIVQYKGTYVSEDCLNIFLEFVPGGSVASLLAKFGRFHESVIRVYTKQILQGLEYMHKLGFMHRDIKGANILVDKGTAKGSGPAWRLKLADFGASKEIENLATIGSGAAKSVKGTPYWMAPEIIKQTGHGRPADIWSVGCTVVEMATGKPPWFGMVESHPVTAMFHIASSRDPPPLPEHLSPEAVDFLLQCFNRVAKQRPTASTLLRHPFLTKPYIPSAQSPERIPNHIPRAPIPLRLPPVPMDDPPCNRSPTAGTPPSPPDRRGGSRRSQSTHSHARTNSGPVCYSPLTLSKKEGALMQATLNSSKTALSARSKDSTETPLQVSPRQRQPVPKFGVQGSSATSPLKSSSISKAESMPLPPVADTHTDEPSLMTPKQDESSHNPYHSYLSDGYNPMEEPSWIPANNQDFQKMLRKNYSPQSPRYDDASYRDQDMKHDTSRSSSANGTSGYWSFGKVASSPRDDSDISTPNLTARIHPRSARQSSAHHSSGSDKMRYRASSSIGASSLGSSPYSSRSRLRSDLSNSKPYRLRASGHNDSQHEDLPKYPSNPALMTAPV